MAAHPPSPFAKGHLSIRPGDDRTILGRNQVSCQVPSMTATSAAMSGRSHVRGDPPGPVKQGTRWLTLGRSGATARRP